MGVIGGLGPAATLDFFAKVLARTPAVLDQDHLPMVIHNDPRIPNRNEALAGTGPSPGPALARAAQNLERAGVDFLVMPCNAAHHWLDAIQAATSLPFLSIVDVTVRAVVRSGARRVGVMAADACLAADLYPPALQAAGVQVRTPDPSEQAEFMALLARIKTGERSAGLTAEMAALACALGADGVVAACTEIPLVLQPGDLPVPLISSTDELAGAAVDHALGR